MSDTTRVPMIEPGTRPELAGIESRILAERGRISDLYRVLLNSPAIAEGWESLLTAVRNRTGIPADLRELMILRVAVINRASFEFEAHVPHAQRAGVPDPLIQAVKEPGIHPEFSARQQAALALADAMTRDITVPDELIETLRTWCDDQALVEMVTTVAAYNMVSRLLVALRIEHRS